MMIWMSIIGGVIATGVCICLCCACDETRRTVHRTRDYDYRDGSRYESFGGGFHNGGGFYDNGVGDEHYTAPASMTNNQGGFFGGGPGGYHNNAVGDEQYTAPAGMTRA